MNHNNFKRMLSVLAVFTLLLNGAAGVLLAQNGDDIIIESTGAYLGVSYEAAGNGVAIVAVGEGSAAADAGLEVGDVVTAINGEPIDADTVADTVAGFDVGETITLTVERAGETLELEAVLGERPMTIMRGRVPEFVIPDMPSVERPFLGVRLEDGDAGVTIAEVIEDSPAAEIGLQAGDVIVSINGQEVATAAEVVAMVSAEAPRTQLDLVIERDGATLELSVALRAVESRQFRVVPDMRSNRLIPRLQEGVLEFTLGDITYLQDESALLIETLDESGALYEAGLRAGDKVTGVNGERVALDNMRGELLEMLRGEGAALTVVRGEETLEIDVNGAALAQLMASALVSTAILPDMNGFDFRIEPRGETRRFQIPPMLAPAGARLGVTFVMLDVQAAAEFEVEATEGAYITEVADRSPAAVAGLVTGDIVIRADGETLTTGYSLRDAVALKQPGDSLTLEVLRGGETRTIEVTLGQPEQFSAVPDVTFEEGQLF
jgi:S1-C subfamily serine protease